MAAQCPLLGDGIMDDILLHIASFLPTAKDLLSLGHTCPHLLRRQGHRRAVGGRGYGSGSTGAPSRSATGCLGASVRAGWV